MDRGFEVIEIDGLRIHVITDLERLKNSLEQHWEAAFPDLLPLLKKPGVIVEHRTSIWVRFP